MDLILYRNYVEDQLRKALLLNSTDETSYQAAYQITRSLVCPNKIFYFPRQEKIFGKLCHNDGIGQYYGTREDFPLFLSNIEYKKGFIDNKIIDILCQLLAYHMPFRTRQLDDFSFDYKIDIFRYFEIASEKQYGLLKLYNPEVSKILDSFKDTFLDIGNITACKAGLNIYYRECAEKLVNFVDILDVEDVEDHEIVAMMYKDYCRDYNIELNLTFKTYGIDY